MNLSIRFGMAAAVLVLAAGSGARAADGPSAQQLLSATQTVTGQPIALPQGPVQVTVWKIEIPAGGKLPVHKHPWPRYAYVLSGKVRVVYPDTGKTMEFGAGDVFFEGVDVWHYGETVGSEPVRLLITDQAPVGQVNMVLKPN